MTEEQMTLKTLTNDIYFLERQLDEADPNQYTDPSPEMMAVVNGFKALSDEDKLSTHVLMLRFLRKFLASDKSPLADIAPTTDKN